MTMRPSSHERAPIHGSDDLLRRLNDLETEVRAARAESRVAAETSTRHARVLRTSAKGRYEAEAQAGWDRLAPPVGLVRWHPRKSPVDTPDLAQSLIDRLRHGDPVADSLGNVSPYTGVANALPDPTFEKMMSFSAAPYLTTSWAALGPYWEGRYVLDSGTDPGANSVRISTYILRSAAANVANSDQLLVSVVNKTAGPITGQVTVELRSRQKTYLPFYNVPPYLIGAVRAEGDPFSIALELRTLEGSDALRAGSTFAVISPYVATRYPPQFSVATDPTVITPGGYNWYAVFRARIAYAAVASMATIGECLFFDPQLHQAWSPDPVPYAPLVGRWYPDALVGQGAQFVEYPDTVSARGWVAQSSEAYSLLLSLRSAVGQYAQLDIGENTKMGGLYLRAMEGTAELGFGPGAAAGAEADARLIREGAGVLVLDPSGTSNNVLLVLRSASGKTTGIQVYVTGDTAERLLLRGDATLTGLLFGPGNAALDLRLARSGVKTITVDDNAGGAVTVNVIGTLQQGGTGVSLAGHTHSYASDPHSSAAHSDSYATVGHTHSYAADPHGAAQHSDVTRSFFLDAARSAAPAGLTTLGTLPDIIPIAALADAATRGAGWLAQVPSDWASGTLTIQPVWSPGSTDAVAHTVRWSITVKEIVAGTNPTAAGTTVTFTGSSAARTANLTVFDTATDSTVTPSAAGNPIMIAIRRIGADAADTYVGVVNLLGVIVTYTASQ